MFPGGDFEIKAMFTLNNGQKVFIIGDRHNKHYAVIMDRVFMTSMNTSVDYIDVVEMGRIEPIHVPGSVRTTCELLIEGGEMLEGYDLFEHFDPINQLSNNELLKILNQRYAKEKFNGKT